METRITRDKREIYNFLSRTPDLHLYTIGDLDDFFWPDTVWYALYENNEIVSIALLYSGMSPSTLLLFHEKDPTNSRVLLGSMRKIFAGAIQCPPESGSGRYFRNGKYRKLRT
jgi:hypothetical protein